MRQIREFHLLLVEDNPADVRLTQEALKEGKYTHTLSVVNDGDAALRYLRKSGEFQEAKEPDLIFLDLNIPLKGGREVLQLIKSDPLTRHIPIIVLTNSEADQDIRQSYDSHANCYISKPVDINRFIEVIKGIENFWFDIVTLPSHSR